MSRLSVLSGVLLAASIGCGSLQGDTGAPGTLATMTGFLSGNGQQLAQSHPRVAVIWLQEDGAINVSEDLPVEPLFPARFVVPLHHPPPSSAMFALEDLPGVQAAFGALVAYDDRNGNASLDLVGLDATTFVDAIIGGNPTLAVAYFEGPLPPPSKGGDKGIPPGYSLVMPNPDCARQEPTHPGSCDWDTFVAIDQPYELKVTEDPEVNALMCQRSGSKGSTTFTTSRSWDVSTDGTPPPGYPDRGTDGLACNAGGTSYMLQVCTRSGPLCQTEINCVIWTVDLHNAPRPPAWPCS
jgi:hypothetical protein